MNALHLEFSHSASPSSERASTTERASPSCARDFACVLVVTSNSRARIRAWPVVCCALITFGANRRTQTTLDNGRRPASQKTDTFIANFRSCAYAKYCRSLLREIVEA